ncbi:putative R3H domain protein [Aspergillus stella-maris]|uniref:putative R3H domain protein n=1 Tax=Aspergillus stella-maris TaxID=1810926 RepID=UPI003CCD2668
MTMTSNASPRGGHRLSFAKIAALPPPLTSESSPNPDEKDDTGVIDEPSLSQPPISTDTSPNHEPSTSVTIQADGIDRDIDGLSKAVQSANFSEKKYPENSRFSLESQRIGSLRREDSFEDDRTHLSNSSTKPTSFDSKSLASVTTFAMDEKDSLRPDDSASVQAIDEEESLSGHASGAPNSLTGSESGARYRDAQKHRAPLHNTISIYSDGSQRASGALAADPVANGLVASNTEALPGRPLHGFPSEPDEKLLEAMKSPKDRLLILQLEEKVRAFIQNSKEQSLELPPSNAFGRLLAHKLGDYYHLTHFVDNNVTSVRLHRTPFCRLPPPLSLIHSATNTTPPPTVPAMKIMRRTDGERPSTEGSIAASSSAASKATSDAGDSGNDADRGGSSTGATPAKDRLVLTREEREAKYQEARERIFRDFSESKTPESNGEPNTNMSRSSSTSGRKKAQRQKTPHDDSFEARSQFNAYYPGMQYTNGSIPYNMNMQEPSFSNQPYMVGPGVVPTNVGYMPNQNGAMYPGQVHMNPTPHYPTPVSPQLSTSAPWQTGPAPQQMPYTGYPINQSPAMAPAKPAAPLSNYPVSNNTQFQANPSGWSSPPYQPAYPQSGHRNPAPMPWSSYQTQPINTASYPYAQYQTQPMNVGLQNHSPSHPLPGSFNRSHFNPQTRSFVPGGAPGLGRHSNKISPSDMGSYLSQANVQSPWTGYYDVNKNPEQVAYNMSRGTLPGTKDSIAKWGTPSHLPPKPPPSEVPSDFEVKQRVNSTNHSYSGNAIQSPLNGPLVVSGGTGVARPN